MKIRNLGLLILTGVVSLSLQSSKADALLAGVKTTGMAATSVANPVDAFGGVYNPANITIISDRLDLGISWVNTHQKAQIRELPNYVEAGANILLARTDGLNPSDLNGSREGAKTADAYVPEFGIVKSWNCGWCPMGMPMELSTSFISYNRNDLKTTYGKAFELFGTSPTGLEFIHQTASFIAAARFCCMHSFGLAINYNVQRVKIDGLEGFANDAFSIAPTKATNRGYNYSNGVGVILGYLFEYNKWKFGAAWQPKTSMRDFDKYEGFIADEGSFPLPERYTAGVSYQPLCCLTLAFDWEYIKWCDIPQLGNKTFPNLNDNLLGSKNGAGFGFDNQNFYRVGVQYEVNDCFSVRAGFRHANSPVTQEWTAVNILTLDCMENVLTFGGTYKINDCHEISMFYAQGMLKKVKGKNSIPATVPLFVGGNKVQVPINADPAVSQNPPFTKDNGEVDLQQRRSALGISWGWHY